MFCKKCGNQVSDDAKFCGNCGTPLKQAETAPPKEENAETAPRKEEIVAATAPLTEENAAAAPGEKSGKKVLVGAGIAVAALVVILVGLILFNNDCRQWFKEGFAKMAGTDLADESKPFKPADREKLAQALARYDNFEGFCNGLAAVKKDGKYGFIDKTGKEVVPCIYDNLLFYFSEGLTAVKKDGKWGYIGKTGKEVAPHIYDNAKSFSKGFAEVEKDGKWGLIDKTGKEVVPCLYDNIEYFPDGYFSEGLAQVEKDGKWGVIDKTGKEVLPCIYDNVRSFSEGLTAVKKDGKYGFIDKTGKEVLPCIYDNVWSFSEGLTAVKKDGKYGFIDKTGKEVVPCIYHLAHPFCSDGLANIQKDKDGKWGVIDTTGKEVVPCICDNVPYSSEGLVAVQIDGKYGFIDKTGKEVVPCIYDYVWSFSEGLAAVTKYGKSGFIDKTGRVVIPCIYDIAGSFSEGLAYVTKYGKCGLIDKTGKEVVPFIYDFIDYSHSVGLVAKKYGKYGLIDKTGKEVAPCIYDIVYPITLEIAYVTKDGKWGLIDSTGSLLFGLLGEEYRFDEEHGYYSASEDLLYVSAGDEKGFIDKEGYCIGKGYVKNLNENAALPTNKKGVLINGVRWAPCNVDAPGTFAASPESFGKFYQWNRKRAWSTTGKVTGWDEKTPTGDIWEAANDPSPSGWRIPTLDEIESLLDESKVTCKWTTQKGVKGIKFTDKRNGNSLFLPAAGGRLGDSQPYAGTSGYYWSSTQNSSCCAFLLEFSSYGAYLQDREGDVGVRDDGFSVRCVAE